MPEPSPAPSLPDTPAAPPAATPTPAPAPTPRPAPVLRARRASRGLPPAEGFDDKSTPPGPRGLVTLVLPAKNEETGIGATLRSLPLDTIRAQGFGHEVVVLDGHSSDRTRAIATAWGARVVQQNEPGKGAAVREALPLLEGDYVVMLDADATYPADTIPLILEHLAAGEADVVMGSRRRGRIAPGAMGPVNRVGNFLLSALASTLYLRRCTDVCTGLWGFRAPALKALPLRSTGFELEVEMFARAAKAKLRVREVAVDYLPRRGGTKLSRTRDGLRIGWTLLRTRFQGQGPAAPAALPAVPVPATAFPAPATVAPAGDTVAAVPRGPAHPATAKPAPEAAPEGPPRATPPEESL